MNTSLIFLQGLKIKSNFRLDESKEETTQPNKTTPVEKANTESVQEQQPQTQEPSKEVIKEVVLKGPMGYAYTEVLNLLLDKKTNPDRTIRQESVYQAIQANILAEEAEMDENTPPDAQGYIYVYDGKKVGSLELNKLFDEVSVQKSKNPNTGYVSVVIENPEQVTSPNLDGLVTHMESIGVKVHFRREAAISSIVSFLTKK